MSIHVRAFAFALLVMFAPSAFAEQPTVIVLSWDGLRHDFPERAALPGLTRMQAEGLRAERLVPVFPSNTFPNHVALATGTHTDRHGIVDNVFLEPGRGIYNYSNDASWIQAEPVWVTAERQGVRAATFFWVGSETDWNGIGATHRMAPFDGDLGEDVKVDQILAWLDLPAARRPRLIMTWWHGADGVAHLKGPEHPDIGDALREQDGHLMRLLAGLDERDAWPHTTLLLVSDHGMTEVSEQIPVREPLAAAGIEAKVFASSATARIHLAARDDLAAARELLEAMAGVAVYPGDALPPELRASHPSRNGDLLTITTPPRTFVETSPVRAAVIWLGALFLDFKPGLHGYHPDHPDMGASLFALGRGVAPGTRTGPVHATDVAATITRLLGIEPPAHSEGAPIPAIAP
jgi:predicted AlkP superfamily pyrophosphatase or phosphodiesterase